MRILIQDKTDFSFTCIEVKEAYYVDAFYIVDYDGQEIRFNTISKSVANNYIRKLFEQGYLDLHTELNWEYLDD